LFINFGLGEMQLGRCSSDCHKVRDGLYAITITFTVEAL
jgi:hypothetical protein